MEFSPQALVHQLLASRLHIDDASVRDTDRLDDLGLTPLDLVLVVLRLDPFDRGDGEFPLYELEHATTVGHLVDLVTVWLRRDPTPIATEVVALHLLMGGAEPDPGLGGESPIPAAGS